MDKAIPEEKLRESLDRIIREVTEASAGISLIRGETEPGEHICTVHIGFRRGFRSSLSLRADAALFARLARSILQEEQITAQDLEDVAKEYINVLCGHFAHAFYRATQVASRFDVPAFYRGTFHPQGQAERFSINYAAGTGGLVQLVYHVPE